MSADRSYAMLMQVLTDNPAMCDRLLQAHAIDETGRCRTCRAGNHNTGRTFGCMCGSAARRVAAARHPNGKHGNLHTATCGCEDVNNS